MADFDWKRFDVSHWWKVLSAARRSFSVSVFSSLASVSGINTRRSPYRPGHTGFH